MFQLWFVPVIDCGEVIDLQMSRHRDLNHDLTLTSRLGLFGHTIYGYHTVLHRSS